MTGVMIERLEQRQLLSVAPGGPAFGIGVTGSTSNSSAAADANGDLIVAWAEGSQILAQRFQPGGTPIDSTPLVVATGTVDGEGPRVAMNATGSFVVTWDQQIPLKKSGWDWQVHARAFNVASGTFASNTLVENADTQPHIPSVAIDAGGGFVVAWRDIAGGRFGALDAYARVYSASGTALGSQFQVNTSGGTVTLAKPAMDSNGDFMIAWHDSGLDEILARRCAANGSAISGQFAVGAGDSNGNYNSLSATMDSTGDSLVAWSSSGLVYAQRYLPTGAAQWASPLQLGGDGTGAATSDVYASMDGAGNAVVAWRQKDPIQNFDLYEQQFDSSGNELGGVVNVTPYDSTTGGSDAQDLQGIAVQPNGNFAFTWIDNADGLWGQQYIQQ